jgi:1,2-diacylglycerol 3-beta-glucosyltransferase
MAPLPFVDLLLAAVALPATFGCAYLALLTLLSSRPVLPGRSSRQLRFDVIVPAHNEEEGIARTVLSLRSMDWPQTQFRVLVVADNCSDATASAARGAGAQVLERKDLTLRGKGHALAYGFEASLKEGFATAVVVVDADTMVSSNLLEAFACRIESGEKAIQAHYGVLNPWTSWRTQLMTITTGAFHIVRSRGRERLKLSCGVRGNGWSVTHSLLRQRPYRCYSLVEDIEYGIALGFDGVRVAYADEAHANADMVSGEAIARKQRRRWEQGRFEMVRSQTLPLLAAAVKGRSKICLDLAFDLMVPPLSYLVLNIVLLGLLAGALSIWLPPLKFWAWWAAGCFVVLSLHILRGWQVSGMGIRGLAALAHVPVFVLWKIFVLFGRKTSEWVRTEREKT